MILARGQEQREIAQLRIDFVRGCKEDGVSEETAASIFVELERLFPLLFNRSHAVAYTDIAYRCAYLKVHYAKEWAQTNLR